MVICGGGGSKREMIPRWVFCFYIDLCWVFGGYYYSKYRLFKGVWGFIGIW